MSNPEIANDQILFWDNPLTPQFRAFAAIHHLQ